MMNELSKTQAASGQNVAQNNPFAVNDAGSVPADAVVYRQFNEAIPRKLILRAFLLFMGLHIAFIVSLLFWHLGG
ncbi:MAG: hypothetical protein DME21_11270 [Verrucomicrobia bacterium]|nr:MAG: hypothetical protein DME21_11270 [Verrucomicrobiota bacterium]